MSIKRYGTEGGVGTGGQRLPFARAVEADGWLYISGQTPMTAGEVVEGGIIEQTKLAFDNCLQIMREAGYEVKDVVHVTAVLTDARYFSSFNKVFSEVFDGHPPARICSVQDLVVDCKVEVDMKCFRADRK
ncbi:RidA family protein [Rouxiella sp. S1S-2]|uniref:RidA family protein n=1 Tax=Rouxiella sp. S1S-2 TaxID=2653856 RepID=UPI0012649E6E|nr:RidA family protein [Rouxiella sp. S1S-2]KAB7897094.1 RidA family protein [Rouxiella sp. S1S-2]